MAYPVPDTYSVAAGQPINAGRHVLAAPDLVGGTVHALLAGWSGKGFQLLSSAPAVDYNPASAIYTASGHAGAAWDEAARAGSNDPGVQSVARIYTHYKRFGITTEVMGASFRNVGQITALAGCDLLTISPELLAQLQASEAPLARCLDARAAESAPIHAVSYNEAAFRYALNEDAMATDKLADGIRKFAVDQRKLESLLAAKLG